MYTLPTSMRSSISKWNPKSLTCSKGNVHSKFTWWFQKSQSHEISRTYCESSIISKINSFSTITFIIFVYLRCSLNYISKIMNAPLCIRILEDDPTNILARKVHAVDINNFNLDTKRSSSCLHTADSLRVQFIRKQKPGITCIRSSKHL